MKKGQERGPACRAVRRRIPAIAGQPADQIKQMFLRLCQSGEGPNLLQMYFDISTVCPNDMILFGAWVSNGNGRDCVVEAINENKVPGTTILRLS